MCPCFFLSFIKCRNYCNYETIGINLYKKIEKLRSYRRTICLGGMDLISTWKSILKKNKEETVVQSAINEEKNTLTTKLSFIK